MLTLESFEQAAEIVKQVTQETKLIKSSYFSDLTGNKVYLKPENMQRTGAYKVRGAYYKISTLSEEERNKGLIDPGETPEVSAARELWEETGLQLVEILDIIPDSYSAVGFSNEKNQCVVGIADGTFAPSSSTLEEIEAGWYSREEVRTLLRSELFAARTQAYCYLWSRDRTEKAADEK